MRKPFFEPIPIVINKEMSEDQRLLLSWAKVSNAQLDYYIAEAELFLKHPIGMPKVEEYRKEYTKKALQDLLNIRRRVKELRNANN